MALMLKRLYEGYYWIFHDLADPRVIDLDLFMMSSPLPLVAVIAAYLYFVLNLGPRIMKDREPFDLKNIIIVYNFLQVAVNVYLTYEASYELFYHVNWDCSPVDYSYNPRVLYIVRIYHYFFLSKMADLLDTVFFVLRKRNSQVSFLHVYHHFGMFAMLWVVVKFLAGGSGAWVGAINAAVHSIMYTYYTLAAIDESWKKNVTFKKFITQVQMVQFLTFILIYGRLLLFRQNCGYPNWIFIFFVPQNVFMLILFADFYRKAYLTKGSKSVEIKN